jgi:hypothetical protein
MDKVPIDLKNLFCPITHELFCEPVIAEDGYIYEQTAIESWFNDYKLISPVTRIKLKNNLIECFSIKSMISELIYKNPELIKYQYKLDYSFDANKDRILQFIKNGSFTKLTSYKKYDLQYLVDKHHMISIFTKCPKNIIEYVIKNAISLNVKYNDGTISHYIMQYGNEETIKYAIDNIKNFEQKTKGRNTFLSLLCKYSTLEMIKYIISKGANYKIIINESTIFNLMMINNKIRNDDILQFIKSNKQYADFFIEHSIKKQIPNKYEDEGEDEEFDEEFNISDFEDDEDDEDEETDSTSEPYDDELFHEEAEEETDSICDDELFHDDYEESEEESDY